MDQATREGSYWGSHITSSTSISPSERSSYEAAFSAAMAGSNMSGCASGNASGPESAFGSKGYFGSGPGVGKTVTIGGEVFGVEDNESHGDCLKNICGNAPITEKPAAQYEKTRPGDGNLDTTHNNTYRANSHGHDYAAPAFSNVAKGLFSIPNVGAHLWCFFHDGDPLKPVYFAASFGASDYAGIYGAGSSIGDGKQDSENPRGANRYRGLLVLNERGGTITFRNTESSNEGGLREGIDIVSYFGNNIRMGENMSMFCPNNDQKLVNKDQFLTVDHDRSVVVRNHYDLNVYGDIMRKVGHAPAYHPVMKKIVEKISKPHDDAARFEGQRTEAHNQDQSRGSKGQSQSGEYAPCPVCSPGEEYSSLITTADTLNLNGLSETETSGTEKAPTITKGTSEIQTKKWGQTGEIMKSKCKTCKGTGKSPSSQDGKWQKDQAKEQAAQKMVEQIDELAELEAQLGPGGSEIVTIAKDYTITCGLIMNDMPAVRVDPKGKIVPRGMKVAKQGVYRDKQQAPIIEVTPQHPAFPGGNFDVTAMNRYNVMCGTGGIFFKTKGVVQLGGAMTNLNGDQILITSAEETKITGGKSFSVAADVISLAPSKAAQVQIDGGLAVARNTILAGGLHVEGELSCHHISAPLEYQFTELHAPGGTTRQGIPIGYVYAYPGPMQTVYGGGPAQPDCLLTDAHRHTFANLPLSLMSTSDDVRSTGMANNDAKIATPTKKYTAGTATVPTADIA